MRFAETASIHSNLGDCIGLTEVPAEKNTPEPPIKPQKIKPVLPSKPQA
jgi:hypothetical protein